MTWKPRLTALPWQMAAWYTVLLALLVGVIVNRAPHFSYSLDDPYIHLAVAQNIAHGNYGINAGETVSPSSSVVWPFLLAPFSRSGVALWLPLFYNMAFSLLLCATVGSFLDPMLRKAGWPAWARWIFALLLVLSANLLGLTLTGMEHTLQILLVSLCAIALVRAADGVRISTPLLLAAALAPAVRYEDVVFTGAVCAALCLQRRRGAAAVVLAGSALPIVALGLFLHSHGLSFFPNSVLFKGGVAQMSGTESVWTPLIKLKLLATQNVYLALHSYGRMSMLVYVVALVLAAAAVRTWSARLVLLIAFGAAIVMVCLGPYGWFFRYDVAVRLFMLLVLLPFALRMGRVGQALAWSFALLGAAFFSFAALRTPYAALEIARQQYQMHRFVHDFARTNVAVNDVGWVSVDAYGRFYVLDLVGLANNETLRVADKSPEWLDGITRRHHVDLVMIYPNWFPQGVPSGWRLLGTLDQAQLRMTGTMGGYSVAFYATSPAAEARLRPQFDSFRQTLPHGVWVAGR